MPELISKYPDVTQKVLKEAGAICAEGAPQKILTRCPPESFCSLPSGELCIYGINEIPRMTQITPQEVANAVHPATPHAPSPAGGISPAEGMIMGALFLVGLLLGRLWRASPSR